MVEFLLQNGADVNVQTSLGYTPLHLVETHMDTKLAKLLIQNGALINAQDNNGNTILHYISVNNNIEMARLLVENSANVDALNNDTMAPLHLCADKGNTAVAKWNSIEFNFRVFGYYASATALFVLSCNIFVFFLCKFIRFCDLPM